MARNERAFAVQAPPPVIWRVLLDEVRSGVESGRAQIVRQEEPRRLVLDVFLSRGLGVRYVYEISEQRQHTEVSVQIAPFGLRHRFANILSFGRGDMPYLLAATQGLANLKLAAEEAAQRGHAGRAGHASNDDNAGHGSPPRRATER